MKNHTAREETAAIMRRLYERGLTTCSGGNVSMRIDGNTIAVTPSSSDKALVQAADIILIDLDGRVLEGIDKTSIETAMHLAVYRKRPDIKALVHAHPLHATFFTASKIPISTDIIAEARFLLGRPAMAAYALMGTEQLAENVALAFAEENTRVVLMENHGVITSGETLFRAFDRMEVLEAAARMTWMGEIAGGLNRLNSEQIREIDELI